MFWQGISRQLHIASLSDCQDCFVFFFCTFPSEAPSRPTIHRLLAQHKGGEREREAEAAKRPRSLARQRLVGYLSFRGPFSVLPKSLWKWCLKRPIGFSCLPSAVCCRSTSICYVILLLTVWVRLFWALILPWHTWLASDSASCLNGGLAPLPISTWAVQIFWGVLLSKMKDSKTTGSLHE